MRVTFAAVIAMAIVMPEHWCSADEVQFNKSLVQQVKSPSASTRLAAVKKIGHYGAAAKSAIPELSAVMCRDEDGKVANQAAAALAQIGKSAVPELMRVLEQESSTARWRALWALGRMGPAAEKAAPLLKLLLRDLTPRYRAMAAQALGELGPKAADAVPKLCDAMQDTNAEVRKQAMIAIANLGEYAVPTLRQMLRETSDAKSRVIGLKVCRLLGKNGKKALPELIEILENDEPPLRAMAAAAIAGIGKPAQKAIPVLLKRLRDRHYPTQKNVLTAIIAIGLNDYPGLLDQLSKVNDETAWAAPFLLQQFGRQAKDAVPHLIKALDSQKDGVRLGAALALKQIGVGAVPAIPALQLRLGDKNPTVRIAALSALDMIYLEQPAVVRQRLLTAKKKTVNDIVQLTKSMQLLSTEDRVKSSLKFVALNRLLMNDPKRQMLFHRIVTLHVLISTGKLHFPGFQFSKIRQQLKKAFDRLGPDAIPALIYGINLAAAYNAGFC